MKISTTLTIFVGAILPATGLASGGGYRDQCFDIKLLDQGLEHADALRIQARCDEINPPRPAQPGINCLDLNKCFAYAIGAIVPEAGGNFGGSCKNCWAGVLSHPALDEPSVITCDCLHPDNGTYVEAKIDTNILVSDDDGVMRCFDSKGSKEECSDGAN